MKAQLIAIDAATPKDLVSNCQAQRIIIAPTPSMRLMPLGVNA